MGKLRLVLNPSWMSFKIHAFDTMRPVVTTEVMKRLNLAPQLANVLQAVWMNQTRFLQFESHTHNEVLPAGQAMPQGDPISPLCLSIWLSAGLNAVSKTGNFTPEADTMAVCYMDDRSFWSNTSQCALVQTNAWAAWSQIVGLKESAHKTQLVVKCSADEQFLRENHPSWFVQEATILGISTTTTVRKSTENEFNRIQRAKKRAALLLVTPLVWGLKIRAFQSMVVSMAAYGWVGKNPTVEMGDSLFNLLTKWLNTGKGASRELRKLFLWQYHLASMGCHPKKVEPHVPARPIRASVEQQTSHIS